MWSKHSLRDHFQQDISVATAKPFIHVNAELFLGDVSPAPLADTPSEPPEGRWTPKLLILHFPPLSHVPPLFAASVPFFCPPPPPSSMLESNVNH